MVVKPTGYAMTPSDRLDATFAALADPTRRAILARLATGEASVTDLAQPFAMSQPAISKHLKVLERAGLISRSRDAQRRPCRLQPERLKTIAEWVGSYRQFWEASFDRLDDYLEELQAQKLPTQELPSQELPTQELSTKEKRRAPKQARNHRRTR
jgi:DNA-binding transcriptional ArsR family regulator